MAKRRRSYAQIITSFQPKRIPDVGYVMATVITSEEAGFLLEMFDGKVQTYTKAGKTVYRMRDTRRKVVYLMHSVSGRNTSRDFVLYLEK